MILVTSRSTIPPGKQVYSNHADRAVGTNNHTLTLMFAHAPNFYPGIIDQFHFTDFTEPKFSIFTRCSPSDHRLVLFIKLFK